MNGRSGTVGRIVLIETLWNVKNCTALFFLLLPKVLIETLWNVKYTWGVWCTAWARCFNRNIVECKASHLRCQGHRDIRFNRNIVECKGNITNRFEILMLVLIETLWNVKESKS